MNEDEQMKTTEDSLDKHSPANISGPDFSARHGGEVRNLGYVVISPAGPKDGGDFGPYTPGTSTAGFREAFEHAKATNRDVFVVGGTRSGPGPEYEPVVYELEETLEVPWMQDFDLRGSTSYILKYVGDGDAVVLDSSMNCQYHFGLVWSDGDGAALRVKPRSRGPDEVATFVASVVEWGALVTHGVVDEKNTGSGLVLDGSEAGINQSKFVGEETNTQDLGLALTNDGGRGGAITNNWIEVRFLNQAHATGECTNVRVGDPGSSNIANNRIDTALTIPRGVYFDEDIGFTAPDDFKTPDDAYGAVIHGQNNMLTVSAEGKRIPGNDLVFGKSARENMVLALCLPNGITNHAETPTNRIISADTDAIGVSTPPVPDSGTRITNRAVVPTEVVFTQSGDVSSWDFIETTGASITLNGGIRVGQTLTLQPGEGLKLQYDDPPEWHWRPAC